MIFRRIVKSVREQEWRNAIIDLLIVIVGVFLGLQADNWNQQRQAAAQEETTVAELYAEFEPYEGLISGIDDVYGQWMSDVERLLAIIDGTGDGSEDSPSELMQSAVSVAIVPLPPTTLRDLLDRNGVADLSNEDLKCMLRGFDDSLHFNQTAFDLLRDRNVLHLATLRQYARIKRGPVAQPGYEFESVDILGLRQDPAAIGALEALYAQHAVMRNSAEALHGWARRVLQELEDPEGFVWRTGITCPPAQPAAPRPGADAES